MKKFYFIYLLSLLLLSCSREQVDIDIFQTVDTSERVVIDGFATSYYGDQFIKITKSSGIEANITNPVLDAEVVLCSKDTLIQYELFDTTGVYCSTVPFAIERGIKYTCKVNVDGEEYLAADSLAFLNEKQDTLLPLSLDIHDQGDNISVTLYFQNYGYENTSLYRLGTTQEHDTDYYKNLNVGEYLFTYSIHFIYKHKGTLPQGLYAYGASFTSVNIYKTDYLEYFYFDISDAYADFLTEYFNVTEWSDGIFATVPGNATSNVSNSGTGYFFIADVKRIQIDYNDYVKMLE
jgi:hypothetical protein